MKTWLRFLARIVLFMMGFVAGFFWLLRAVEAATTNWARPIVGCIFCSLIVIIVVAGTYWAMLDRSNEGLHRGTKQ